MSLGLSVKEEPEWDDAYEGVSEAAAAAGLYAGHRVKDELVLGPEVLQSPDRAYPTHVGVYEMKSCKQEPVPERCDQTELRNSVVTCMHIENTIESELQPNLSRQHSHEKREIVSRNSSHEICKVVNKKKIFVCDICNEELTARNLIKHLRIHREKHECDICRKKLTTKKSLAKHKLLHMERRFHCIMCNEKYFHKSNLIRHKLTHTNQNTQSTSENTEKKYKCELCDKQYSRIYDFTCHKRTHTAPIQCEKCNKKFASKKNLREHEVLHSKMRRTFTCEICNKKIKQERHFKNHILIHTGEKPFPCKICAKTFRVKETLIYHTRRIHTQTLKHACELCELKFTKKSHLIRHKRVHLEEKQFGCEICEKRFKHKESLTDHIRVHTGATPYACKTCGQQFRTNSQMNNHIRKQH